MTQEQPLEDALEQDPALAGEASGDPPSVDDLLAEGLLASMGATAEPGVDEEAGEDGTDFDASDEDEESGPDAEDEADAEAQPDSPQATDGDNPWAPGGQMFGYAAMVAQAPQRINEVPSRHRGQVLAQVLAAAAQFGQEEASRQFAEQATTQAQMREFVGKHDRMREDDPAGFLDWSEAHPEDAATYWRARSTFAAGTESGQTPQTQPPAGGPSAPPRQPGQQQPPAPQALEQEASLQIGRIQSIPAGQRQAVIDRVQRGEFLRTPDGVRALQQAIDAAFAAAVSAPAQPAPTGPAARRQQAAARRSAVARPVGTGGTPANDDNPIGNITDVGDLLTMALGQ